MNDTNNIFSTNIRTRAIPIPKNEEKETASINFLLEILEVNPEDSRLDEPNKLFKLTPWIAFQLGCLVEKKPYSGTTMIRLVTLAVDAARISGDSGQYLSNLLSAANFFMRVKEKELAHKLYDHILRLPTSYGVDERAASHMALAQDKNTPSIDAIFHYELTIRTHGKQLPKKVRVDLAHNILDAYREIEDLAGLVHISILLDLGDPLDLIERQIGNMSFSLVVSLTTRLKLLGHKAISETIREKWHNMEKSNGK